jgi:hypothetical protein
MQSLETKRRCDRLQAEALLVKQNFHVNVNFDKLDGTWFHVQALRIPRGWNYSAVDILLDIPHGTPGYPQIPPEWFWVNRDLRTSDGRTIGHFFELGEVTVDEVNWNNGFGHFCLHLKVWRPNSGIDFARGDNLLTYLHAVMRVFYSREQLAK